MLSLDSRTRALPAPVDVVTGVIDGDTLWVNRNDVLFKVRLAEVDAPELKQPLGPKVQEYVKKLVLGKAVTLVGAKKDVFQRTLAHVMLGKLDLNKELVYQGYAMVDPRYVKDKSLLVAEALAKTAHRGVWVEPNPMPPWTFRKLRKML